MLIDDTNNYVSTECQNDRKSSLSIFELFSFLFSFLFFSLFFSFLFSSFLFSSFLYSLIPNFH